MRIPRRIPKFLVAALLVGTFVGCNTPNVATKPDPNLRDFTGYVRQITFDQAHCQYGIVFENEQKSLWSVGFRNCAPPPVWVGLHAEFQYYWISNSEYTDGGYGAWLVAVRRLN